MVRNKDISVGLALIAGVLGMGVAGSALALPEMDVGTVPSIVAPQPVDTVDGDAAEPVAVDEQANAA